MFNLTDETTLLELHKVRSRELRQAVAEARLADDLPRSRHGTRWSWLSRRRDSAPAA